MRKTVLLAIMVLAGVLGIRAQHTWEEPSPSAYASHAVVYAAFVDKQGKPVEVQDCKVGAFIDDQCRAIATKSTVQGANSTSDVYTFRIGVKDEDAGKTVKFYLKQSNAQIDFELAETLTVSGGDETIGGTPSNPFNLTFVPVTSLNIKTESLTVQVGEEVTQYLRHIVSPNPQDATFKKEALNFYASPNQTTALVMHDDGTITAEEAGSGIVSIYYEGIGFANAEITVIVVDPVPTADKYVIASNPLTIQLAHYELAKVNILSRLNDNVTTTLKNPVFPDQFNMVEGPNVAKKILTFSYDADTNKATAVRATEYGSTRVEWTYRIDAAGFDSDGSFNPLKEYSATFGFELNIVQALTKFEAHGFRMGIDDENATIKLTTVPANYLLDERLIKWDIPKIDGTPIIKIGERIAGKNEWKVTPQALNSDKNITASYENLSDTAWVRVLQRVNLDEGWHWISLYADQLDITQNKNALANMQEIRSQYELLYNDPHYGFFGQLGAIKCRDTYKVYVKDGKTIYFLLPNITSYAGGKDFDSNELSKGWNWMSFPYCFSHSIDEVLKNAKFEDGTRIVSKEAFAEVSSGKWTGTLQTIVPGEGYLIYSPSGFNPITFPAEGTLATVKKATKAATKRALSAVRPAAWKYKSARFANNMTIIAKGTEALDENRYSIGAFVNGECRGEGEIIDGKIFITVHGESGETVKFKLHDNFSDEYVELPDQVKFTDMYGSINAPMPLTTPATTAIDVIVVSDDTNLEDMEIYTLSGQRVNADKLEKGIYIVRSKTATRKLIKK